MDILTHTISGLAIGTVVVSLINKKNNGKAGIIILSGIGGALPDLDAISLWSGFDRTFGKFFTLPHSGKVIYSEKFWYSHHAFMHSIFAGLLFAIILGIIFYVIKRFLYKYRVLNFTDSFASIKLKLSGFFLGFLIHLIEDMPTPASMWGGVRLFFPSSTYIGGTGEIWWWNNYDIFLIVSLIFAVNVLLITLRYFVKFNLKVFTSIILLAGFTSTYWQIKTREFSFAYSGHSDQFQLYETKSKELQKEILGKKLYVIMANFDRKIKVSF